MAGAKNFTFRLSAEGVEELRKDLEALGASGTAVFNKLSQAAPGLGDGLTAAQSKIAATKEKLESLKESSEHTAAALELLTKGAALFGVGLGVEQLAEFARSSLELAARLKDTAEQLGIGVVKLQQFEQAARHAGLSTDQATAFLQRLNLVQGQAIAGATDAEKKFAALNIRFKDASGNALPLDQIINQLADRMRSLPSAAAQAAAAGELVGDKLGPKLVALLAEGSQGLQKSYDDVTKAGQIMEEDTERRLAAAKQHWEDFKNQITIISGEILSVFLDPHLAYGGGPDIATLTGQRVDGLKKTIADLKTEIADYQDTIAKFNAGSADITKPEAETAQGRIDADTAKMKELNAQLAEWEKRYSLLLESGKSNSSGPVNPRGGAQPAPTTDGTLDLSDKKKAVDELIASLQREAELAGLSGKAHAEREAVLKAEAAAERDETKLTDAQRAAVISAADAEYDRSNALKKTQDAQAEAERQQKANTKASEDATKAISDQIAGYDEELYQLGLSDRERFIRQGLIEAETKAIQGHTAVTQEETAAIREERGAIFDTNVVIGQRKDAEQAATREAEQQAREREQIAQREAEMMLEPYKNALQGIQSDWTEGWKETLNGSLLDDFGAFWGKVKEQGIDALAQILSAETIRPALGGLLTSTGQDQIAASLGLGNLTGSQAQAAAQNATAGGGGALSLASLFSGSSGIGSWLFGTPGGRGSSSTAAASPGLFGAYGGGGGLASFLNSGVGTGLLGGLISAGTTAATGGSTLQTLVSGGGSLLGGIAGSFFGQPVLGSAAGGFLGNLLGGLFGGGDKTKHYRAVSLGNISAGDSGYFGYDGTAGSYGRNLTPNLAVGQQLGQSIAQSFNDFLAQIGGTIVPGTTGAVDSVTKYKKKGGKVVSQSQTYGAYFDGQSLGLTTDADQLSTLFNSGALAVAIEKGLVQGVTPAIQTIFKTLFAANGNQGITDQAAVDAGIAFGKFYDRVDQIRTPAQSAAQAMADLASQMADASTKAEAYGLDVSKIPEIFRENLDAANDDAIQQISDPNGYALKQLDIQKAAAIAQAQEVGADINKVEELYGLKRQQIVAQGLQGVTDTFQAFFNGLQTDNNLSALSPQAQLAAARSQYDAAKSSGDASSFTAAASQLLQVAREFYASSQNYADIFKGVLSDTKALGGLTDDIPAFASGAMNFPGGLRIVGEQGPELEATGASRIFDAQTTAAIMSAANMDLDPKGLARLLRALGGGDDQLVHMRSDELPAVQSLLGGMSINPATGLPAFKYGADTNEGGAHGFSGGSSGKSSGAQDKAVKAAAAALANTAINPGNPNLGLNGPDYSGPVGPGTGADPNNPANAPGLKTDKNGRADPGGGGWDPSFGPAPASAMTSDGFFDASKVVGSYATDGSVNPLQNGPVDLDKFMHDWADYQGVQYGDVQADTFWDQVGNFFASMFGFNERNPLTDPGYNGPGNPAGNGADWGFDPAGLIGSALGMALGIPFGLGFLFDKGSAALGRPLEMNLGPSVIGSPDFTAGMQNALSAQGASDISLGSTSIQANSSLSSLGPQPGGVLAPSSGPRSLGSTVSSSQNTIAGQISGGFDRASKGTDATNGLLQQLLLQTKQLTDQVNRMTSNQSATNDLLQVSSRGTTKV